MSRPNEDTDYSVNVCPLYDDGDDETGGLCAYAHSPSLADAMAEAGRLAEAWVAAPGESGEDEREPLVGFEVVIASPCWPDPV